MKINNTHFPEINASLALHASPKEEAEIVALLPVLEQAGGMEWKRVGSGNTLYAEHPDGFSVYLNLQAFDDGDAPRPAPPNSIADRLLA